MLWQKETRVEDWVTRFTVGEDYRWDTLLLPYDIEGTRTQAWALLQLGIVTPDEFTAVETALADLLQKVEAGATVVTPADEDCHTVIEQFLTQRLGETGKKIHTGRSRNDQVLVALRLFLKECIQATACDTAELARALCNLGEQYGDAIMPGYTHFQRAMPSTAGLWALGFAELLVGDLNALESAYGQVNVSPLGSAAGYGVPYLELPRKAAAERLGFEGLQTHVSSVQLSRGKLELHALHAFVQVAATLNRMASDLVLFNTTEFGFVALPAAFCTGSSIMPQKQNPDVLELVRAGYHRLIAEMQVLLTLPANLPSGYHRDLQLTKEAAMRGALVMRDLVTAMMRLIPGVQFDRERMQQACTPELFATAEALHRVQQGIPFREAYRQTAADLETLSSPAPEAALAAYRVEGFPGRTDPDMVRRLLDRHSRWMGKQ